VNLLHSGGVVGGHLTPNRWVEVISTAPARMFGLDSKGAVAVGKDADIVVYDPNAKHTISAATHHMDVDYSCYEGWEVTGRADVVLSRGKVIVDGDEWLGTSGDGRFLKRSPTGDLLSRT
jgi:dihydropyrimidinase